ncbi:MAG TPA: extracellular solute-binding protein [Phycisphaerales bacterium]|nr:extracellular solute-binding protein [Phycisphaerales bacterium]
MRIARSEAISRRSFLAGACALGAGLAACSRRAPSATVTLYTSVDDFIARPAVQAFEAESGLRVNLVTDTEATKTAGLAQRLAAERDAPRADVWWSGEVLGTIGLARAGLLAPWSPAGAADFPGGAWPAHLRDRGGLWYGCCLRARTIVARPAAGFAPATPQDLLDDRLRARVGIARPQFGTTRSHVAAMVQLDGARAAREYLAALTANGVRILEGNSAVVRAVAEARIDAGLTDSDDVWAGLDNGWPLRHSFAAHPAGAVLIPSTVGVVRGAPSPAHAAKLADFLTGAACERLMARSPSRNRPARPALAAELAAANPRTVFPDAAPVDWSTMAEAIDQTDALLAELFPL